MWLSSRVSKYWLYSNIIIPMCYRSNFNWLKCCTQYLSDYLKSTRVQYNIFTFMSFSKWVIHFGYDFIWQTKHFPLVAVTELSAMMGARHLTFFLTPPCDKLFQYLRSFFIAVCSKLFIDSWWVICCYEMKVLYDCRRKVDVRNVLACGREFQLTSSGMRNSTPCFFLLNCRCDYRDRWHLMHWSTRVCSNRKSNWRWSKKTTAECGCTCVVQKNECMGRQQLVKKRIGGCKLNCLNWWYNHNSGWYVIHI